MISIKQRINIVQAILSLLSPQGLTLSSDEKKRIKEIFIEHIYQLELEELKSEDVTIEERIMIVELSMAVLKHEGVTLFGEEKQILKNIALNHVNYMRHGIIENN